MSPSRTADRRRAALAVPVPGDDPPLRVAHERRVRAGHTGARAETTADVPVRSGARGAPELQKRSCAAPAAAGVHNQALSLIPEHLLSLVPARRSTTRPSARPDGLTGLEDEVARTADLVLKVHRLLERAEVLEAQPERTARMARLSAVVEHGQVALRRAAGAAVDTAVDGVPRRDERG